MDMLELYTSFVIGFIQTLLLLLSNGLLKVESAKGTWTGVLKKKQKLENSKSTFIYWESVSMQPVGQSLWQILPNI